MALQDRVAIRKEGKFLLIQTDAASRYGFIRALDF